MTYIYKMSGQNLPIVTSVMVTEKDKKGKKHLSRVKKQIYINS